MLDESPLIGHTYIHTSSTYEYIVLAIVSVRIPNDNMWYRGVLYQNANTPQGTYVRTVADFQKNFESIDNIVET